MPQWKRWSMCSHIQSVTGRLDFCVNDEILLLKRQMIAIVLNFAMFVEFLQKIQAITNTKQVYQNILVI